MFTEKQVFILIRSRIEWGQTEITEILKQILGSTDVLETQLTILEMSA